MSVAYSTPLRDVRLQAVVAQAGAGALLRLYDGTRPAGGGAVTSQILIAELTCSASFGTVASGVLTFDALTGDTAADAGGAPKWVRVLKADGTTWVLDFDVVSFPVCTAGQPVDVTSLTITEGNA